MQEFMKDDPWARPGGVIEVKHYKLPKLQPLNETISSSTTIPDLDYVIEHVIPLIEFRCRECHKLLGLIEGKAEIKCPRCKTINTFLLGEHAARSMDIAVHREWRNKQKIKE